MDRALKLCIKQAQVRVYAEEMKVLTSSKTVPAKSDLKLLTPFKDEDGTHTYPVLMRRSTCNVEKTWGSPVFEPGHLNLP
jgi:hypothetical protein